MLFVRLHIAWFLIAAVIALPGCSGGGQDRTGGEDAEPSVVPVVASATQQQRSTRSFQMGLWFNASGADSDLAFFSEVEPQPAGRSVLFLEGWWNPTGESLPDGFQARFEARNYDWSRIAAIVIDEPYLYYAADGDRSNPCRKPLDPRNQKVARVARLLEDAVAVIRDLSSSTRVWVNFSVPEMQWASDPVCPIRLNQPYIDVVSLDAYYGSFDTVARPHYDWLLANRANAHQQLALVPGTFYRDGKDNQNVQASYLHGYFDYANELNEKCDLPAGPVGVTGVWDGCRVWIVAGWLGKTWVDGDVYRGALDPKATSISAAWREMLAYPTLDPMIGSVEAYDAITRTFSGWVLNRNTTGLPQQVDVWVNGQRTSGTVANKYRGDVGDKYGIYEAGFSVSLPEGVVPDNCAAEIRAVSPTSAPHNYALLPSGVNSGAC